MLRRFFVAVAIVGLVLGSLAVPAWANTVIDFGTGIAGYGGTVTLYADGNLSGADIPISTVTVVGAPTNNGTYAVSGTANGSYMYNVGSLSFNTGENGQNFIQIVGSIAALGVQTTQLLVGTITSFDHNTINFALIAEGLDSKAASLLTALGMDPNTQFQFFGFSIATGFLTAGGTSSAISTDIRNTTVPEPGSLLLLGTGLAGLATLAVRRRGAATSA